MPKLMIPRPHLHLQLHEEYLNMLSDEMRRTDIGPDQLMQQVLNPPNGLTSFEISEWFLNGPTARLDHFLYALQEWKRLPSAKSTSVD